MCEGWNMSGHTWADVLGPISPPGISIGGLQDGSNDARASYGPIGLIYGFLGPFWVVPEPPFGISGWVKRLKHIHLDVFHPDPTWIHLDPPIWGLQGTLWPNLSHLWHFGAILGSSRALVWYSQMG